MLSPYEDTAVYHIFHIAFPEHQIPLKVIKFSHIFHSFSPSSFLPEVKCTGCVMCVIRFNLTEAFIAELRRLCMSLQRNPYFLPILLRPAVEPQKHWR